MNTGIALIVAIIGLAFGFAAYWLAMQGFLRQEQINNELRLQLNELARQVGAHAHD